MLKIPLITADHLGFEVRLIVSFSTYVAEAQAAAPVQFPPQNRNHRAWI